MINNLLTIGIDNYQKVNKLNNCVRDLENIVDLLNLARKPVRAQKKRVQGSR